MRRFALLALLAILWGCAKTVLVPVPPRVDLSRYGTLGVVEFSSNAGRGIEAQATRRFEEQLQAAQPGTPLVELGGREAVLASVGGTRFDSETVRRVGEKYRVDAVFVGELAYSRPKTDVRVTDISRLEGDVRAEMRGDISARLLEARSGASVWSGSAWAKRQIGRVSVSEHGVRAKTSTADPREEMVPALVYHLTGDFRPSTVRRRVK